MALVHKDGHTYEMTRELLDVSSMHRPDLNWKYADPAGHGHFWFCDGDAANEPYNPSKTYTLPTLEQVRDGSWFDEDGEEHPLWHWECTRCAAHIEPGYKADDTRQFIAGLATYRIDGEVVSKDEFMKRLGLLEK